MRLYNYELASFIEFLIKLKLIDQKSRMRSRLVNMLREKFKLFQEEHYQLIKEYSNLDNNGEPKIIEVNGQRQFDVHDIEAFNRAFQELQNEEVCIEQNQENKKMLLSVKESVLFCGLEFEGEEQFTYERYCDIVDQVIYVQEN
ncbi:hypothetical protein GCM10023310_71120 [Paenibacillus vulneris]|uniref:DUF1617 domain-containing protein n=1 Tax=Paenibacillus vulneris TaxID=1133364 RepID=A0ABW3UG12_9BACL